MKRTLFSSVIVMLALSLAVFLTASAALAKNASPNNKKSMLKVSRLDLRVYEMKAERTATPGTSDVIRITVSVIATSDSVSRVCSGPFKVKLSKLVGGTWRDIARGGVSNLCVGGTLAGAIKKLVFFDHVPSNLHGAQKYRAEVDYDGRVSETNEHNNIGGTRFIP